MKTRIAQSLVFIFTLLYSFGVIGQDIKQQVTTETCLIEKETVVKAGVTYELHTGKRSGIYIIRTAKVSGNVYKQYLKRKDIEKLRRLAIN